jgi:hypothetical protein
MTLEEHLIKITGSKDLQIAALLSQIDILRDQFTKLAGNVPKEAPATPDNAIKPNGKAEPVPAPPA